MQVLNILPTPEIHIGPNLPCQNFSTQGRTSTSRLQALRGCFRTAM